MSTIRDFSGGLNTRPHPHLIAPQYSINYTNCDNESGILKPTKGFTPSTYSAEYRWTYFKYCDKVVSSTSEVYWAELDTKLYEATPSGITKQGCDGVKLPVSIDGNSSAPTISLAGSGNLCGPYKYVYTYYNNTDGTESAPTPLSNEVSIVESGGVCGGKISVANILPSSDTQVTHIRLYRIGGVLPNYQLVVTLSNAAHTYLDNNSDVDITGNHTLDTFTYNSPPANPKYLTEANAMLFVASGSKLYFSDIAKAYAWPATNFLEFDQHITGMGAIQNGLLVFTRYKTYIVTGNSPITLSRFLLSGEQGCINHDTIAFSDNTLFWLSTDGVCTSSGGNVTIVTQGLLGRFSPNNVINADVFDRMYVLGYENATLILDSRYNFAIRKLDYSGWYGDFKDKLYMQKDGVLQELFSGSVDEMHYMSPIFTEGRLSEYKMFKDIYVAFTGNIHIKILLHTHQAEYGEVIYDEDLLVGEIEQDIKTRGSLMGYGISFEITGTGEVHEIDFKASGRENGK